MTAANMARAQGRQWYRFWKNLKEGYDYFEISHLPPKVAVCEKRYLINASFTSGNVRPDPSGACPAYQRLPIPRAPAMQEASNKPAKKLEFRLAGQTARQRDGIALRPVEARLYRLHARPRDARPVAGNTTTEF